MGGVIWFFDPGADTGWAGGQDGTLLWCGLLEVSPTQPLPMIGGTYQPSQAWIEFPEYRREKNEVDPNNLLSLAAKAGRIKERCLLWGYLVYEVRPSGWKGSLPKRIHHARIRDELRPQELLILDRTLNALAQGVRHNVLDAVGGFLWACKKEGLR